MYRAALWASTILSGFSGLIYIMTGAGVIPFGDTGTGDNSPPAIFYVAGAFYLLLEYLLRIEKRWVRLTLGILNGLVILIFFQMWWGNTSVLTSPAGLLTKIPQLLLEIGLIYLIIKTWNKKPGTV